ncbi:MAG: isochorismatase family cysteine hydrolase [Candidatus Acidiferrales bacterium]|jgi:nicotinamidase/pyrazinamidase
MAPQRVVFWEVDAQADFVLPGGKLYVPGAEKIVPNLKRLVEAAAEAGVFLVSSGDAHPENDPEFERFPPHCLRGTPGARIIPEGLTKNPRTVPNDPSRKLPEDIFEYAQAVLEKQTLDVFDNPHASELVERLGGDAEYVVFGVVTEYCVRCAAKGLLERGRKVSIVEDAIETLNPADGLRALDELQTLGARLITTDQALAKIGAPMRASVRAPAR